MEKDSTIIADPLISIIMPVYNVRHFLKKSVSSVLAQTYKHLELLLIDDGSDDGSGDLCDELAGLDSRIRVIHKKNGGRSDARNVGLQNALGQLLMFVDSDDWIDLDMIQILYTELRNNKVQLVACENSFVYGNRVERPRVSNRVTIVDSDRALRILLEDRKFRDRVWARLYQKELWQGVDFPVGKNFEDVATLYKIYLKADRIALLDKDLYYYNQNDSSIVHSNQYKSFFDLLDARVARMNYLLPRKPELTGLLKASILSAVLDIYRVAALGHSRLDEQEARILTTLRNTNTAPQSIKYLSPRYRTELRLLTLNESLYFRLERFLNSSIATVKRIGKNK